MSDDLRNRLLGSSHRDAGCDAGFEILDQFAIVARWDDVAQRMIERYKGIAARLVIYLASHWREVDPKVLEQIWQDFEPYRTAAAAVH